MNRVGQETSALNAANSASAWGSRSMQTSSPEAPTRSATSRACPPAPKVQSITTLPGSGSSNSISSPASTGTWTLVMSIRSVTGSAPRKPPRDRRRRLVDLALLLVPALAVPDLDRVLVADQDDVLLQTGVLEQRLRKHDAPGGVQPPVETACVEEALERAHVLVEGVPRGERALGEALPARCRPDRYAGVELFRENDSIGQGTSEPCRDRQSILRVQ